MLRFFTRVWPPAALALALVFTSVWIGLLVYFGMKLSNIAF